MGVQPHRAEVGLLSHIVVVQGSRPLPTLDKNAMDSQYDPQIFVHRNGPHPILMGKNNTEEIIIVIQAS